MYNTSFMLRACLMLFIAAATLAISSLFGDENINGRLVIAISFSIYATILISSLSGSGEKMFSLSISLFFITIFILPAMIQSAKGEFPFYSKEYPPELVTAAAGVLLAFSLPLGITYLIFNQNSRASKVSIRFQIQRTSAFWAMIVFMLVAVAGFAQNPAEFITRRSDISLLTFSPTPFAVFKDGVVHYSAFLALLLNICLLYPRWRGQMLWLLPVTLALAVVVNDPLNVARFPILALTICALFVILPTDSLKFKWIFTASYFGGLLTVFPLLSQISRGARGSALFSGVVDYYSSSGDFDGFQSLINVVDWIDGAGIQWGRQLISALFVFIPRSMWPDKGVGTGGIAAAYAGYPFVNVSAPLPAEVYADFGLLGVILAGCLLGWGITKLDRMANDAHGNLGKLTALGMAAGFAAILLRGSLIGVVGPSGLAILMGSSLRLVSINSPSRKPVVAVHQRVLS